MTDSIVRCQLCGENMDLIKYDYHVAYMHPDFNPEWSHVPPRPLPTERVIILDESDSEVDRTKRRAIEDQPK